MLIMKRQEELTSVLNEALETMKTVATHVDENNYYRCTKLADVVNCTNRLSKAVLWYSSAKDKKSSDTFRDSVQSTKLELIELLTKL